MSIRVALHHETIYRYDRLVNLSPQVVRLRPAPHCRTPVLSYSLKVQPEKQFLNWQQDPFGNYLARLVFLEPTRELRVAVDLVAEMTVINPFDFFLDSDALEYPFTYNDGLAEDLKPFLRCEPTSERFAAFLAGVPRKNKVTVDFLVDLNIYVHNAVKYVIRMEPGVQSCDETLSLGSGSCRDSAWLLVQLLRHLGLAARFVSGYLIQLKPDVKSLDGPSGAEVDFTDLHAWTEVYLPGAGWVGLDPTSGLFAGEGHLPLAATPEPSSAAPITGAVDPCETTFEFHMQVTRVHEDPRVTKPYTDDQWQRINQLGNYVDTVLERGAVRLTMGGEPTFVSIDDMDGAEWNTAAMGPNKRRLAGDLFGRLADRFAKGPLLHYGQGKWYPGESLPRWALGCYWRRDGEPIWHDPDLVSIDNVTDNYDSTDAQTFVTALSERLGVGPDHIEPGYEDVWYYMWKERRLPVNVDPLKSNLDNVEDRLRLAKVFERGLGRIVGYALPLRMGHRRGMTQWESGPWFLRQERMYLIPGDSPMGYRLPLDSIPWMAPEDKPIEPQRDPFHPPEPLPSFGRNGKHAREYTMAQGRASVAARARVLMPEYAGAPEGRGPGLWNGDRQWQSLATSTTETVTPPEVGESASNIVRTALCVEAREGRLHIFMPPLPFLEDYLELVHVVEQTADELQMRVRLEGYPPPYDYRVQHLKVTPDPGVIEVNMQPAHRWDELVTMTTTLYEEAREARLGTEKFMLDGRHTGTGGGNHLVLGGITPSESPFLRRPDVLRSLVSYWNNRPSLSYLFSGLFIGPTSQAPRVDEARHESLYELEIAFTQLRDQTHTPSWLVDRVFRHLLVDLTGNTHRAEFCIDKLFSPDSATGRLGLVEFRGFEMPPHSQMSLVQQLLLRALVARFWQSPYREPLVRWGTSLHDRFMLPHFIAQDFREMIDELNTAGLSLEQEWFAPHFEFRFPLIGQVTYDGVNVELRQAIEPWHVLGEEAGAGGAARYVDSSLERLQVKVQGLTSPRHLVLCNGRRLPLHPTGVPGEFVAGVRYRAWQPPSCLHPTIAPHTPLVFDVYDSWNHRSIGGCTWHVAHPGGRSNETFPVNAYAAESRRAARFVPHGHTGNSRPVPPPELNRDYPFTLDLRRPVNLALLQT
jgi:uncharacterized protein (DUF2126 family)/transglutaminase-like putative cysteine protease